MMVVLPLLAGCIWSTGAYQDRLKVVTDDDGDGWSEAQGDCDDADPDVAPEVVERCDNRDQDCDGSVDEGAPGASTWYVDGDGDGHGGDATLTSCSRPDGYVDQDGDCDDTDPSVHPGAEDEAYDGVDRDCDGASDYDADRDGAVAEAWGGSDCDDTNPAVGPEASEGWLDLSTDNDCDGSISDQVVTSPDQVGLRIEGTTSGEQFGSAISHFVALSESYVAVSAPFHDDGRGAVRLWSAVGLSGGEEPQGEALGCGPEAFAGYGMGYWTDGHQEWLLVSGEGMEGYAGEIWGWELGDFVGEVTCGAARTVVSGEVASQFLGSWIDTKSDVDGDGVVDMVISAAGDATRAEAAGAVAVLYGASGVPEGLRLSDADALILGGQVGGYLAARSIGDANADGLADLGFSVSNPATVDVPGGYCVLGSDRMGTHLLEDISTFEIHGGPFVFTEVFDADYDGVKSIGMLSGDLHVFDLPLEGALTPWDDARATYWAESTSLPGTFAWSSIPLYSQGDRLIVASDVHGDRQGRVYLPRAAEELDTFLEDSLLLLDGERPGDSFGATLAQWQTSGAGGGYYVLAAPRFDGAAGPDSGGIYVIPTPR